MCLSHFFFYAPCLLFLLLLAHFCILTSYVSSSKRKIKIPVPECQKASLLSGVSAHQTLKPQTSPLLLSPQKHSLPLETCNLTAPGVVLESIPLSLRRENQILSSVSWGIHTGTFGDTCSSASSSPATARAKQTSKLKLTENSSQTRADDHSISDEVT